MRYLAQRPHSLLVVTFFNNNGYAARLKADLLMHHTCNKGLTNPEYAEYSTRLTCNTPVLRNAFAWQSYCMTFHVIIIMCDNAII
jgi:hypothetical protein